MSETNEDAPDVLFADDAPPAAPQPMRAEKPALVGNAEDPEQVRRGRRRKKVRDDQAQSDLRAVLATPEGRRVLWRLLGYCHAFASCYSDSPSFMAHLTGRQDVAHYLMHQIQKADPTAFLTMMQDAANKERENV